jgi:hypothetical protein
MLTPFGFMQSGTLGWLVFGTLTLAALLCVLTIIRAVWIPGDVRRGCACGGCGYAIADTALGRCPECGGKFTKVGVTTPAMALRLRGSLGTAGFAWTVLALLALLLVSVRLEERRLQAWQAAQFGPGKGGQASIQFQYDPNMEHGKPPSPLATFSVELEIDYAPDGTSIGHLEGSLQLRTPGVAGFALIKFANEPSKGIDSITVEGPGGAEVASAKTGDDLEGVVLGWFNSLGLDLSRNLADRSVADVKRLLEKCLADPALVCDPNWSNNSFDTWGGASSDRDHVGRLSYRGFSGGGGSRRRAAEPSFLTTGAIIGYGTLAAVYAGGLVFLVWRNRRLLAA